MSIRERFPATVTPLAIGIGTAIAASQLPVGSIYLTGDATTSGANAAAAAASAALALTYVADVVAARDAAQGSSTTAAGLSTAAANSATAAAGSATAAAGSATAAAGSATAASGSATSAASAASTAAATAATAAATAAAASTSASLIAQTTANASAAAASAAAAAQSAADAAAVVNFDPATFAQRGSTNTFTASNTFDAAFRVTQRGNTQTSIDLLTKSTAAADVLGAAGTKGFSFIGKGDLNATTADRNDLVLSYYNGAVWTDYWRVDSLTGQITMSARPVFGANTPWDSGNFTPSTKVDTSTYSADQAANTTALAGKVPTTRTVNGYALSANVTLAKGDVGLGNVDNTSDANKPVSTAQATALAGKMPLAGPGVGAATAVFGDITAARGGGTTGVIFLNNGQANAKYLFYNGTNYEMPGADLNVNGTLILSALAGKQANLGYTPVRTISTSFVNYLGYDGAGFAFQTDNTWWGYVASTSYVLNTVAGYLPLGGGTLSSSLTISGGVLTVAFAGSAPGVFNRAEGSGSAIIFQRVGTQVGSISVASGATAYNTSSDARIKTNIVPLSDAGLVLDALSAVEFEIIGDEDHTRRIGFLAQDLYQHVPLAVAVGSPEDVDPSDPDFVPWGVDLSRLVPLLVKEIQSLRQRLATAGL